MITSTEHPELDPSDKVLFMLGGMDNKLDFANNGITELKQSHNAIQAQVNQNTSDIAVLKSKSAPPAPWYSIVSGLASVGALITVIIFLFAK